MSTTAQAGANICRRSDKSQIKYYDKSDIPYAFSFLLCDLLICEFDRNVERHSTSKAVVPTDISSPRRLRVKGADTESPMGCRIDSGETGIPVAEGGQANNAARPESDYTTAPLSVITDRTVKVCSENGTESIIVSHPQPLSAEFRAMSERILQKVISRQPKAYQPYPDKVPQYLIAYVVETLECGHKQEFGFLEAAEPLTAKRRVCKECSSLPRKKPVQSVPASAARKQAA